MINSKFAVLFLICFSVACSSFAQLGLKIGMSKPMVSQAIAQGGWLQIALGIGLNPWVVGGLTLYFFGAVVWLFVLAKVQLSFAYPFVGLGFILTMFLGKFVMDDDLSLQRLVGTLVVVVGVLLIAVE